MLEKKRQDKIKPIALLEKTIAEILVANGRSVEPFVKVFTYSGENITKSPLGTLVGVFEIAERSEDSAYIVNFLASVAKKEYFSNPRRGAIESFEAALHKINIALAELVKHGNIAWLGKFHGALGILEKNNLHFSATGKAEILLLRNNSLSEISAGLASEEAHAHPIKTFVEVSSGHLLSQDRVIFTSPELLSLLPLEEIEKNALRMDEERFGQFLRTVLINELDMAGTIIINFQENKPALMPRKQEEKAPETPQNVFSQAAFVPKTKAPEIDVSKKEIPVQDKDIQEEYVDSKTGHIYVQGDTPGKVETNQNLEQIKLSLQNALHETGLFLASQGKLLRKGKKQSIILLSELARSSRIGARKTARALRKQWKKQFPPKPLVPKQEIPLPQTKQEILFVPEKPKPISSPVSQPAPSVMIKQEEAHPNQQPISQETEIPAFMRAKLATFYQKNGVPKPQDSQKTSQIRNFTTVSSASFNATLASLKNVSQRTLSGLSSSAKRLSRILRVSSERASFLLKNIPPKNRKALLLGGLCIIVLLIVTTFYRSFHAQVAAPIAPIPEVTKPVFPPADEPLSQLAPETTVTTLETPIVSLLSSKGQLLVLTSAGITDIATKQTTLLPEKIGGVAMATTMDDLGAVFILGKNNTITTYYPGTHAFVDNIFPLPANTHIDSIGTFLTYLYVLDAKQNTILRFPRAEGGFGAPTAWLKETVSFDANSTMVVTEDIFINTSENILSFAKGKKNSFEARGMNIPLSITAIAATEDSSLIFVLDTKNKRIVELDANGTLLQEYWNEKLSNAKSLTLNGSNNEVFVATSDSLLSFKLDLKQ